MPYHLAYSAYYAIRTYRCSVQLKRADYTILLGFVLDRGVTAPSLTTACLPTAYSSPYLQYIVRGCLLFCYLLPC